MKHFALIYVVVGYEKSAWNDESEMHILHSFCREHEAKAYGEKWAKERNEELQERGRSVRASYKVQMSWLY